MSWLDEERGNCNFLVRSKVLFSVSQRKNNQTEGAQHAKPIKTEVRSISPQKKALNSRSQSHLIPWIIYFASSATNNNIAKDSVVVVLI